MILLRYGLGFLRTAFRAPVQGAALGFAGGIRHPLHLPVMLASALRLIIILRHGISGLIRIAGIIIPAVPPGMTGGKARLPFQEEICIFDPRIEIRIPGGIQIIINTADLHDIPGMGVTVAVALDDPRIHTGLQQHAVHQKRISVADCLAVLQRRVCGEFQVIRIVVHIFAVVGHIPAYIIIDGAHLLVFRSAVRDIQALKNVRQIRLELGFLLGVNVITHRKIKDEFAVTATDLAFQGIVYILHLKGDIIPFVRFARICKRARQHSSSQGIDITIIPVRLIDHPNGCYPLLHLLPQHQSGIPDAEGGG